MRVVAGSLRSRRLQAPKGSRTRPTSDRVREALFSVIGNLDGASVLDLYSGSGALAIEALSRGAASAVCVESDRSAALAIEANARELGVSDRLELVRRQVSTCRPSVVPFAPFHLVVADPPWADVALGIVARDVAQLLDPSLFAEGFLWFLEHSSRDEPIDLAPIVVGDTRHWGDTAASFYRLP